MQRITLAIATFALLAGCDEFLPDPTIAVPDNFEPDEQWICHDALDFGEPKEAEVSLLADFDAGIGSIEIAGPAATAEFTQFEIEGLDRRWDWCPRSDGLGCSFAISPGGDGRYYKFAPGEAQTKPTALYKCRTVEAWKAEQEREAAERQRRAEEDRALDESMKKLKEARDALMQDI